MSNQQQQTSKRVFGVREISTGCMLCYDNQFRNRQYYRSWSVFSSADAAVRHVSSKDQQVFELAPSKYKGGLVITH